jgi:CheY-like chemotaxis protein
VPAADPKFSRQLEPHLRCVMIVDPNPAAARMLAGLMRGLGAGQLMLEADGARALKLAETVDPDLIFVEHSGPGLDGETFTRTVRRSNYGCRRAPVIMVTADAFAHTIKGARDSGVHEFLRKPFTAADLIRRVEAVTLKPRDWIEAMSYVGPDRRRFNSGEYSGKRKRVRRHGARDRDRPVGADPEIGHQPVRRRPGPGAARHRGTNLVPEDDGRRRPGGAAAPGGGPGDARAGQQPRRRRPGDARGSGQGRGRPGRAQCPGAGGVRLAAHRDGVPRRDNEG